MCLCLMMETIGQRALEVTQEEGNRDLLQVIKDTIPICITERRGAHMIIRGREDMTVGTGEMTVEAITEMTGIGIIPRETTKAIRKVAIVSSRGITKERTLIVPMKVTTNQNEGKYHRSHLNNLHQDTLLITPVENKD